MINITTATAAAAAAVSDLDHLFDMNLTIL